MCQDRLLPAPHESAGADLALEDLQQGSVATAEVHKLRCAGAEGEAGQVSAALLREGRAEQVLWQALHCALDDLSLQHTCALGVMLQLDALHSAARRCAAARGAG